MTPLGTNFRALRAFTWSGPVLITTLIVAMVSIGFIPPPAPSDSAEDIATMFRKDRTSIRIACVFMMIAWSFWATFGAVITTMVRKAESGIPGLTFASIALVGGGYVFFLLIPMTWAVAAHRPDSLDPEIIRLMNDWVWFDFLFTIPPFSIWFILIGVAIFNDKNAPAVYPRWVGYVNVWLGIFAIPAVLVACFKTGPFAWNGIGAFWIPMSIFTVWFAVMTVMTLQAITKEERKAAEKPQRKSASAQAPSTSF